jgi:hypothetical protein
MNDDVNFTASPRWVRLFRCAFCAAAAAVVSWRGIIYDHPTQSEAMPFVMCQLTAATLGLLALMNLLAEPQDGPS